MSHYKGSCHCGKIALEVEGDIGSVMQCNCSICQRRGSLLWFVPASQMTLTTSRENLSTYQFGKKSISHHFCATCGCAPFGEGAMPDGTRMVAVNVRCLDGIELDTLTVEKFDGRSL